MSEKLQKPKNILDGEDHRVHGTCGSATTSLTLYSHASGQWTISLAAPLQEIVPRVASKAM